MSDSTVQGSAAIEVDAQPVNTHGYPMRLHHGHYGCRDIGDLGPCDCLCHRDET